MCTIDFVNLLVTEVNKKRSVVLRNCIKEGVSVVICCYNSGKHLPETLRHLMLMEVPPHIPWEIIIINNASTDNTAEVALVEWKKYGRTLPFKVVNELMPGLSYARKKGVEVSSYECVIFCDDDNWLDKKYVERAYFLMSEMPKMGAIGGRGISTMKLPKWLEDFSGYYALGKQGSESGDITESRGCLYGAGIVFRKSALIEIQEKGFKSILTGRKGNSLLSGEDLEISYMLRIAGYRLFYDSELIFYHCITKARFSFIYFIRLVFYIGYSWMGLSPYHQVLYKLKFQYPSPNYKDVFFLLRKLAKQVKDLIWSIISIKLPVVKNKMVEIIFTLGQLWFVKDNYGSLRFLPPFLNDR